MSPLRRALTGATLTGLVTGALVAGALPAHAVYNSSFCPHATSDRLFTANDGEYKLWFEGVSSNSYRTYHLCFAASSLAAGDITFTSPVSTHQVTVVPALSDPTCPELLHVQDPVDFMTRLATQLETRPYSLCFGAGEQSFRVTVSAPSVTTSKLDVHLYLDRGTALADFVCANVTPNDFDCRNGTDLDTNVI
jgi:hypothetical protein